MTSRWTCTAWGATAHDVERALRRVGGQHQLRFDEEAGGDDVVFEQARGRPLVRARVDSRLPIPAREIAEALFGTCIVETESSNDAEDSRRIEMVVLGARAFLETQGARATSIVVGASTMRIVVSAASELGQVRATLRRSLVERLGAHIEDLVGLVDGGWLVTPSVEWDVVRTVRCRDPQSHGDRLLAAALANAPPGLAEAAGWPPQARPK